MDIQCYIQNNDYTYSFLLILVYCTNNYSVHIDFFVYDSCLLKQIFVKSQIDRNHVLIACVA